MGGYNRDSQEVCNQLYTDERRTIKFSPRGVTVPHVDRPSGCRIHGPSRVGFWQSSFFQNYWERKASQGD